MGAGRPAAGSSSVMVTDAIPSGFRLSGAGEDHIFHARAAQALGRLLAQHPTDGVAQVRFAATIRSDDGRDPRPLNRISVLSKNDLKPWISTRLSFSKVRLTPSLSNSHISGGCDYRRRDFPESKAGGGQYLVASPINLLYSM